MERNFWMSPEELSEWLRIPLATIYRWRSAGGGPRGHRIGRHVRYSQEDVLQWVRSQADEPRRVG